MRKTPRAQKQGTSRSWPMQSKVIVALAVVAMVGIAAVGAWFFMEAQKQTMSSTGKTGAPDAAGNSDNPLAGRKFYIDNSRTVTKTAVEYQRIGDTANAALLQRIASQPGTTWLVGGSASDPTGARDIAEVERTSAEAAAQGTVPVYQLYALPNRDACAGYSKGGFRTDAEYLSWVGRIIAALKTDAVIAVEADAIAHTLNQHCLNTQQVEARYTLLKQTMMKLHHADHVLGAYLDAGHSDWFANPGVLVEPLRKSGIEHARGITVNVSFFEETAKITAWSQRLVELLGGHKGIMIDTSRNGRGIAAASGDARWCNPQGRGIGPRPTTTVNAAHVDAYFWGKNVGESDGMCFGNPAAGVFVPALALELARNAAPEQ